MFMPYFVCKEDLLGVHFKNILKATTTSYLHSFDAWLKLPFNNQVLEVRDNFP